MRAESSGCRQRLLQEVPRFVKAATHVIGVRSIGLLGSILTNRADPKDIDLLVVVADDVDLPKLAASARQLQGRTQGFNRGADVFLADELGNYLGRTCHWKECRPGVGASCVHYIAAVDLTCTTTLRPFGCPGKRLWHHP